MNYHLTPISGNAKTGPIPVSTISKETCPDACPLKGAGCYAEGGPLAIHWREVTAGRRGVSFEEFLKQVRALPRKQIWRHAQAGDLPGEGNRIDPDQLRELALANRGRPVIAFTHKPVTPENLETLQEARRLGFSVNLSANSVSQADELVETGLPVVCILPSEYARTKRDKTVHDYKERIKDLPRETPRGRKIAICPATYMDTNCATCGACSKNTRGNVVIGFPAHGNRKAIVDQLST